ncbi:MAG: DUF3396 domain-containing protein, partial [Pseudomonadota bacterium]|nr:DUF3396 domain-containing protein [Pseudomonadota bacterium]
MSPNNINWSEFILKIEDTTAITPSLTFVLFLDHTEGHLILDFYQRARTALGNLLTHYSKGNGKRSRLNARAETMVPTWCKTLKPWPSMNYYIEFCGCDINQGVRAAELKFTIYHRPPEQEQLTPERVTQIKNHWQNWFAKSVIDSVLPASCLKITFPLEHEQAEPVTLLNWILDLELVKNWRFLSGYAGYSLNYFGETAHYAIRKPMFKRVASLFLRYPGLEVQGSSVYTDLLRYDPQWMDKTLSFIPLIKRVNWLTLISADAIEYLGGHNPLQSA